MTEQGDNHRAEVMAEQEGGDDRVRGVDNRRTITEQGVMTTGGR